MSKSSAGSVRRVGSAQKRHRQFHRRPEATEKASCSGCASKGHLCTCRYPTRPRPLSALPAPGRRANRGHLPQKVGALPYVPCSGVHRGRSRQPQTHCLLRGASCETGRGCRAPKHPWVRRKNKPQHPLLSGLNNRWPLVFSFYQREGSTTAGLLFVASLESSLSRQRPRENKPAPRSPVSGVKAKTLSLWFFTFQKPQCFHRNQYLFIKGSSPSCSVSLSLAPYLEAHK